MATVVNEGRCTHYGDLLLDEECLFAMRDGTKVHFSRNERAILLALSGSPNRLLTRSRLLDEVTKDEDQSDRYIDFLVNRLGLKLGDDRKSPTFIHTRYGEGYVWLATPTPTPTQFVDAVLAVATQFHSDGHPVGRDDSALIPKLHDAIGARMIPEKAIFVGEDWHPGPDDKVRYLLHLNLQADQDAASCLVRLRKMPSRRILASFPIDLDPADSPSAAPALTVAAAAVFVIDDQLASDAAADFATVALEFPWQQSTTDHAIIGTDMGLELLRSDGARIARKIARRADHDSAHIRADPNRDHISLDTFAEPNTRIIAFRDEIDQPTVDVDLHGNIGVVDEKTWQPGRQIIQLATLH